MSKTYSEMLPRVPKDQVKAELGTLFATKRQLHRVALDHQAVDRERDAIAKLAESAPIEAIRVRAGQMRALNTIWQSLLSYQQDEEDET